MVRATLALCDELQFVAEEAKSDTNGRGAHPAVAAVTELDIPPIHDLHHPALPNLDLIGQPKPVGQVKLPNDDELVVGSLVELHGVERELNGSSAKLLLFDNDKGQWAVQLAGGGKPILVKRANMRWNTDGRPKPTVAPPGIAAEHAVPVQWRHEDGAGLSGTQPAADSDGHMQQAAPMQHHGTHMLHPTADAQLALKMQQSMPPARHSAVGTANGMRGVEYEMARLNSRPDLHHGGRGSDDPLLLAVEPNCGNANIEQRWQPNVFDPLASLEIEEILKSSLPDSMPQRHSELRAAAPPGYRALEPLLRPYPTDVLVVAARERLAAMDVKEVYDMPRLKQANERRLLAQNYEMRDKLAAMEAEMARQAAADSDSDNSNASWAMPKAKAARDTQAAHERQSVRREKRTSRPEMGSAAAEPYRPPPDNPEPSRLKMPPRDYKEVPIICEDDVID